MLKIKKDGKRLTKKERLGHKNFRALKKGKKERFANLKD